MIAFINGKVVSIQADSVVLDHQGIGFRLYFARPERLHLNEEVTLNTYLLVREDELSLYGFRNQEELDLFLRLISVKGLGPKTALNILSRASVEQVIQSIEDKDVAFLKSMPGLGAKTASQIILDLKGKLIQESNEKIENQALLDASEGLKSLGYKQGEIHSVVNTLAKEPGLTTDEYLKKALQLLLKKKGG